MGKLVLVAAVTALVGVAGTASAAGLTPDQ